MANPNWRQTFLRALLIAAAGFWTFSPALNGSWLWDDAADIATNPLLQNLDGLKTIWFSPGQLSAYYPITFTVEWLEWHLWGGNCTGYHLVTLLFHILNGLLVWRLLAKFGLNWAWIGGLIFVVHPANVESAAWMVELKNTLSLAPFLLAMCAWIDYEEAHDNLNYWLAWGLFLLAMLCKTTAVMFPVIILLYAWWKRGRIDRDDVRASLPFFPISLVLCFATTLLQQHHSTLTSDIPLGGLDSRIALAGLTLSFYFAKVFIPTWIMPIYPQWSINPPTPIEFLPWPIFALVFVLLWINRATWGRHILLGLGFFTINLLPVLGFKLFSFMGFTWIFDHFLYIPIIGLIGLTVAGLEQIERLFTPALRPVWTGLVAVAIGLLMLRAEAYAKIFSDEQTLWTYELQRDDNAWPAHDNLGNVFFSEGNIDGALVQYQTSLQLNPYRFEVHNNLGVVMAHKGRLDEAIEQYRECLAIKSDYAVGHANLAESLQMQGHTKEAVEEYQIALQIDPHNDDARHKLTALQSR